MRLLNFFVVEGLLFTNIRTLPKVFLVAISIEHCLSRLNFIFVMCGWHDTSTRQIKLLNPAEQYTNSTATINTRRVPQWRRNLLVVSEGLGPTDAVSIILIPDKGICLQPIELIIV